MKNKFTRTKIQIFLFVIIVFVFAVIAKAGQNVFKYKTTIHILASYENRDVSEELTKYAKENDIEIEFTFASDIEMIDMLNKEGDNYDAVWISNSIWLYMLDNTSQVSESKSISINPVVMGIRKSKARELGFFNRDVYNKDILNAIKNHKMDYVMASVVKTNSGATAYFGFLNSMAGNPEVLTLDDLNDPVLINDMKTFFQGVSRVSGEEAYLEEMFIKGESDAIIASETSLIRINQQLVSEGKEPLYLIYPVDGVAINDSPFAYIDHGSDKKKEDFLKLQKYLLSEDGQKYLQSKGRRTWYGGVNNNVDKEIFNPDWGIKADEYLIPLNYPSKSVMTAALNLYIEELRKPSVTVFCLDYSGSMEGTGVRQLTEAMEYILDYDQASKDWIQFSKHDIIYVVPFNSRVYNPYVTYNGKDTAGLRHNISVLTPSGSTNLYGALESAVKILDKYSDNDYTKTIIAMTDGAANVGTFNEFIYVRNYYKSKVPVYGILFGEAEYDQLEDIAKATNGKVFDGRYDLLDAFKEVRSYN